MKRNKDSSSLCQCPRCGEMGIENLKTHSYCINCNYSKIYEDDSGRIIPDWVIELFKQSQIKVYPA